MGSKCSTHRTALIVTSDKGHFEVVRELLQHDKVDENAADEVGNTAVILRVKKAI